MIEIKQLLFFRACVDEGSFSRAAEKLNTTQSNVSKIIHSLEKDLGTKLLDRNSRGVTPTESGSRVFNYSKIILSAIGSLESVSEDSGESIMRIASTHNRYISRKLVEFQALDPDDRSRYDFWTGNFRHVIYRVEQGDSDIGFLHLSEKNLDTFRNLIDRKGLSFHPVRTGCEALYAGPGSPVYADKTVSRSAISGMKIILRRDYGFMPSFRNDLFDPEGEMEADFSPVFITNSSVTIDDLVSSTDMVCPDYYIEGWTFPMGKIRCIPLEDGESIVCGYIKRKDFSLSQKLNSFLSWL